MELLAVYAAVFIAGLLIFDWLIRAGISASRRSRALNLRLRLLENSENHRDVYRSMLRARALDYDRRALKPIVTLRRLYSQSGLSFDRVRIVTYVLAFAILTWFGLGFIFRSSALHVTLWLALLFAVPLLVILRARTLRIRKFVAQLPGAVDVVNRSLLAGHPLPTAIALVARELPDPIGSEFGMLSDELTYGTDLDEALLNMVERVGAEDLKLLAISMSVQRGTGGNLVEILGNLASVVRDRAMLRGKIKSLSAEGRITALVMSAFPFFLYFMISVLAPEYFDPVWESGYGNVVIAAGLGIMLVGNFILYRIVNFDF